MQHLSGSEGGDVLKNGRWANEKPGSSSLPWTPCHSLCWEESLLYEAAWGFGEARALYEYYNGWTSWSPSSSHGTISFCYVFILFVTNGICRFLNQNHGVGSLGWNWTSMVLSIMVWREKNSGPIGEIWARGLTGHLLYCCYIFSMCKRTLPITQALYIFRYIYFYVMFYIFFY